MPPLHFFPYWKTNCTSLAISITTHRLQYLCFYASDLQKTDSIASTYKAAQRFSRRQICQKLKKKSINQSASIKLVPHHCQRIDTEYKQEKCNSLKYKFCPFPTPWIFLQNHQCLPLKNHCEVLKAELSQSGKKEWIWSSRGRFMQLVKNDH